MASEVHAPAPAGEDHGHGALQHQFDDLTQQRECFSLGMWLFLATEVMMFGGLFFVYSLYRGMYPAAYEAGSQHLDIRLGTINTFVLLASSMTMALAVHAAATSQPRRTAKFLAATWILGAVFMAVKYVEWTTDFKLGLVPGLNWTYYDHHPEEAAHLAEAGGAPHQVMLYFVIYFSMTGLHALHMLIGLVLVGLFILYSLKGKFLGGNDQPVEIMGLYWHLVDIIWVFLFPLLYLIAGFDPFRPGHH